LVLEELVALFGKKNHQEKNDSEKKKEIATKKSIWFFSRKQISTGGEIKSKSGVQGGRRDGNIETWEKQRGSYDGRRKFLFWWREKGD